MKSSLKRKFPPALALFLIAPIFGELFSGSTPLNEYLNPFSLIVLSLLYGCGAILVRELVLRWKKGWASLLLLGFAYGVYEEGLVVRSFFDPNWIDLGSLAIYGRVAGVNWVWSQHLTVYHALISIAASITFVEMLYASLRAEPWIKSRKGWIANWAGFSSVLFIGRVLTPYDAPDGWVLLAWLAIFFFAGLARLIPAQILPPRQRQAPSPWRFFFIGIVGMFLQFFLISIGADNGAYPFPVAMLILTVFDLGVLFLVLRWNGNGAAWDDRHRMALIAGGLSFFLIFVPLFTQGQYPVMYFSNPIFLLSLGIAYWRVKKRVEDEKARVSSEVSEEEMTA